jgi:transposase-like protein
MFNGIVKVTYRGHGVRTTKQRPAGPAPPAGAGAAHTEFVMCDASIEQDHRMIKHITRLTLGFIAFWGAGRTLAGIKLMAMLKRGQMPRGEEFRQSPAKQFYSLAA